MSEVFCLFCAAEAACTWLGTVAGLSPERTGRTADAGNGVSPHTHAHTQLHTHTHTLSSSPAGFSGAIRSSGAEAARRLQAAALQMCLMEVLVLPGCRPPAALQLHQLTGTQ